MEPENVDESSMSSVSSLKSRFEQLATSEIKNGPNGTEDRGQLTPGLVRPSSQDRSYHSEEMRSRRSFDDSRPPRIASPQLPPKPQLKPKPRLEAHGRPQSLGPTPKSPQLPTTPKQERRTVSASSGNPVITVESPHTQSAPSELEDTHTLVPPPTPTRPLLPPRSATVATTPPGPRPPPLSPRPVLGRQEEQTPRTPEIPRTPPLPPSRSPKVPPSSPFTTPPELRRKYSPPTSQSTVQPIPVPAKLPKPASSGVKLGPPIQMAPELPQRPTSPPDLEIPRPVLPPRPSENDTRKIFDRPPPSRIQTAQTLPTRSKREIGKPLKAATLAISAFPPPPQRNSTSSYTTQREKEVTMHSRTNSAANLLSQSALPDASSGTELDIEGSSSEEGTLEKQPISSISVYPDSSRANRRPPLLSGRQAPLVTNMNIKHVCVSGPYVAISTSDVTKVFNLKKDSSNAIWSHAHPHNNDGYKVTSMEFKPTFDVNEDGSYLWVGTNKGELMEFDLLKGTQGLSDRRSNVHTSSVNVILRCRHSLWTLDESGKCQVWLPENGEISMGNTPKTFRVLPRWTFAMVAGWRLWIGQGRNVQVHSPLQVHGDAFNVTPRSITLPAGKTVGNITCGTTLPTDKDRVFLGHDDGKVSIYSQRDCTCLDVVPINIYNIVTLAGVGGFLWAGFRTGMIYVYDTSITPWRVCKDWDAHHKMKITHLIADQTSLWRAGVGMVLSVAEDGVLKTWDALLMDDWLENEMQNREVEYCSFRDLNVVVCTWNAGASKPSDLGRGSLPEHNFLENILTSMDSPDIVVFGFQELVDLENKKMTAKSILKGKNKSKTTPAIQEHMSHQYRVWQEKLVSTLKLASTSSQGQYVLLHSAKLVGLFSCIFIRESEKANIGNLSATQVWTGLGGLHGNKGALVVRFTIDDSSLCFVNCHLAAGQKHTTQRNNDIANILESTSLKAELNEAVRHDYFVGGGDGSMVLDHEICIFNGDMNYRIDLPRETVLSCIRRNELEKLLEHDQLLIQRRKNPGFRLRPFNEAPITFAPTYKYNVGTNEYDTSEKRRTPAWCDRIYYRGAVGKISPVKYQRHEVYASDHRPVSGAFIANVKTVDPQRKQRVWDETAKLWLSVAQKAIEDAKVDYVTGTCGINDNNAREALQKKNGKVMDAIKSLGG